MLMVATQLLAAPPAGRLFDTWRVACPKVKKGGKPVCHIYQEFTQKNGSKLLHTAVGYLPGRKEPIGIFTLPLGIYLPTGIQVFVDDVKMASAPFETCSETGCRAGVIFDKKVIWGFKKGRSAYLRVNINAAKTVKIPIALKGFSGGMFALKQ